MTCDFVSDKKWPNLNTYPFTGIPPTTIRWATSLSPRLENRPNNSVCTCPIIPVSATNLSAEYCNLPKQLEATGKKRCSSQWSQLLNSPHYFLGYLGWWRTIAAQSWSWIGADCNRVAPSWLLRATRIPIQTNFLGFEKSTHTHTHTLVCAMCGAVVGQTEWRIWPF